MKRALLLLFTFFYLGTASGATVHLHYCMGKLIGWDFCEDRTGNTCPNCGMQKEAGNGCCKDVPACTVSEKQVPAVTVQSLPELSGLLPFILPYGHYRYIAIVAAVAAAYGHSPVDGPPGPDVPVFLRNCVFRI